MFVGARVSSATSSRVSVKVRVSLKRGYLSYVQYNRVCKGEASREAREGERRVAVF